MTKNFKHIAAAVAAFGFAGVLTGPTWSQTPKPTPTPDVSKQLPPKVKTGARKTGDATQTGVRNTGGGVTRLTRKAGGNGPDLSKKVPSKVKTAARKSGGADDAAKPDAPQTFARQAAESAHRYPPPAWDGLVIDLSGVPGASVAGLLAGL